MPPDPLPQLSPELVLILPPEVAAIARLTLPEPGFVPRAATEPASRRAPRRLVALAVVYAAVAALTITPLALALKTVPSHRTQPLRVDHDLRAERNDPH